MIDAAVKGTMSTTPEILVADGPLKGCRYSVSTTGLRLGRSSTCEISLKDPALSRNHCLFEVRNGTLWVTDLASANGTAVNGRMLGADSCELRPGDSVTVGETTLAVVKPGADLPPDFTADAAGGRVDLGFGAAAPEAGAVRSPARRFLLWAVAALAVVAAATLILTSGTGASVEPAPQEVPEERPVLRALAFEKVEADAAGIYRYALEMDGAGVMTVQIDDVPKENRHVRKSAQLSPDALARLDKILSSEDLYRLDREYTGVPLQAGTLRSFSLRVIRGARVFTTSVENTLEPDAFREVRTQLETFSKNELGMWAIQFSAEKLLEMSAESRRAGDAKWNERDVQYGNLSAALAAYSEAIFYLDTVNPKPADYGALVNRKEEVAKELDRRYRDQRFLADKAINLADWKTAQRELRVLCDLVPDAKDPRHAEASAKLLDVEARIKKGDK